MTQYDRIGGWLFVVAFGLGWTILTLAFGLVVSLKLILVNGMWDVLPVPGSLRIFLAFRPLPLAHLAMQYEIITATGLLVLALVTCHRFGILSRSFPPLMISLLVARTVIHAIDLGLFRELHRTSFSAMTLSKLAIAATIWTTYLLVSRRVKGTFRGDGRFAEDRAGR